MKEEYPEVPMLLREGEIPRRLLPGDPNETKFSDDVLAARDILTKMNDKPTPENIESEENLTVPEILGTGGIYGIVLGLGIFEALGKYVENTTAGMVNYFNNTSINQTLGNFMKYTNFTLS